MRRLKSLATTPEVAIPLGLLALGLTIVGGAVLLMRPSESVLIALIAALAATYPAAMSLIVTRHFERQKETALRAQERDREARAKKVPEYEKFVGFLMDMFFAEKLGKRALTEQQIVKGFVEWTKPLLIWGSDEVVQKWGRLRIDMGENPGIQGLFWLEDLFIEIRRDAGYPATALKRGDILRLWVNDIDKHLSERTAKS